MKPIPSAKPVISPTVPVASSNASGVLPPAIPRTPTTVITGSTPVPTTQAFANWSDGTSDGKCGYQDSRYQDNVIKPENGNICQGSASEPASQVDFSVNIRFVSKDCAGIAYDIQPDDESYYDVIYCRSSGSNSAYVAWKKRLYNNPIQTIGMAQVSDSDDINLHVIVRKGDTSPTVLFNGNQLSLTNDSASQVTDSALSSGWLGVITIALPSHNSASASFVLVQ